MARAHRAAHHPAGIRMQPARDVEREHRAVLAVGVIDEPRIVALEIAREPDAEQAVDDQSPGLVRRELRLVDQRDAEKLLLQPRRGDFCVAAVVSGAGENQDVLLPVRRKARRELCRRGAGALHQWRHHMAGSGLDAPDVVR